MKLAALGVIEKYNADHDEAKALKGLQSVFVSPFNAYWWGREVDWEASRAASEARGDTLVKTIDTGNALGAELRATIKKKRGWFK